MKLAQRRARSRFYRARKSQHRYTQMLLQVAKQVGAIVRGFAPQGEVAQASLPKLMTALEAYSRLLRPWAESVARYMIADVDRRDVKAWREHSADMGRGLRRELASAGVGSVMRKALDDSVELITSLPTEAAQRVHKLTTEALVQGTRADIIAAEIMRTEDVTKSRARLIARTEVSRTASSLTMARAQYVGSEGYIWQTAGDSDVRHSHAEMDGKYVRWDANGGKGALLSDGTVTHAGMIYNCRCFAEPVLPDFD